MPFAKKVILHAPLWDSPLLEEFVESCLRDSVVLVCVVGNDCERVHDVIDELVVGDGLVDRGFGPVTTWHEKWTLAEVRTFAKSWKLENGEVDSVQEIKL